MEHPEALIDSLRISTPPQSPPLPEVPICRRLWSDAVSNYGDEEQGVCDSTVHSTTEPTVDPLPPPQMPPPYSPLPESADYSLFHLFGLAAPPTMQMPYYENDYGFVTPSYPPPSYAETLFGPVSELDEAFVLQQSGYYPSPSLTQFQQPMACQSFGFPILESSQLSNYSNPYTSMLPLTIPMMLPQVPRFEDIYQQLPLHHLVVHPQQPQPVQVQPSLSDYFRMNNLPQAQNLAQTVAPPMPTTPLAQIRSSRPLNPYSVPFIPKNVPAPSWAVNVANTAPVTNSSRQQSILGAAPVHYRLDPPPQAPQPPPSIVPEANQLPYISNMWNPAVMLAMKPIPDFAYYVPPRVDDNDYFGGQIRVWQEKMIPTFQSFLPDVWTLQGLPQFQTEVEQNWYFFTITCKLRFCCRKCRRPWTSMRGKIHFAFKLDRSMMTAKGTVLMKIFGQVCNQERCTDKSFQTPACYPEEIHRVLIKLSEYIGYTHYFMSLSAMFFAEPDKAVREGNPRSPHRPALCQACQQGICSRRS